MFLIVGGRQYGGKVYEEMARKVLSRHFEVEEYNVRKKFRILWDFWRISKRKDNDIIVKNLDACLFLNKEPVKTIAIVHHIDYSFAPLWVRVVFSFLLPIIMRNLKKSDAIVVVSNYWKNYFEKKGYKNVFLIYNTFDINDFNISDKEVLEFRKKYKLEGKPIVYLGNCQKAKGVVESYNALKCLNCHLVTSGKPMVEIPARNFEVSSREYLRLLKTSDIVLTMSKFKEGWCRTAHEAMLCKTPVIGSGKGGMREMLEGEKPIICEDFSKLRERVECLLRNPQLREKMGEDGYNFARSFTIEKFKKDWLKLIKDLL